MTDDKKQDEKNQIEETISALKQQRDELALQIHLASMEAKEEYEKARGKLNKLSDDFEPVRDAVEESAGQVWEAMKLVGEEVLASFDRVRKSMK